MLPSESALAGKAVQDFSTGKTEVTRAYWRTVRAWVVTHRCTDLVNMGAGAGDNFPVTTVSWCDAIEMARCAEREGGEDACV